VVNWGLECSGRCRKLKRRWVVSNLDDEQGSVHSEEEAEFLSPKPKRKTYNPDHLPDEIFTAVFGSQASASKRKATADEELRK